MSTGIKAKAIGALHELGVRHAEKPGRGKIAIEHFRTNELISMLHAERAKREAEREEGGI